MTQMQRTISVDHSHICGPPHFQPSLHLPQASQELPGNDVAVSSQVCRIDQVMQTESIFITQTDFIPCRCSLYLPGVSAVSATVALASFRVTNSKKMQGLYFQS